MKISKLEVLCKRNPFGDWNLCKCLPNFVNVAALVFTADEQLGGAKNALRRNDQNLIEPVTRDR